jgi:hypothetical protein
MPLLREPLEPLDVELAGIDAQDVAGWPRLEAQPIAAEQAAEL